MIKKTVTFTDYDGDQKTKDLYFHLTKLEWLELETGTPGGLTRSLESALSSQDPQSNGKVIDLMKKIILYAYGERNLATGEFTKDENRTYHFSKTEAFSELFYELAYDEAKAQEFFIGLVPKGMADEVLERMKSSVSEVITDKK